MTPVPLELPVRPTEAAQLGNLILDQAERKPLTSEIRNRIAARGSVFRLETITPYFGSLERDPVHPSAYYLAVDGAQGEPLLLYLALATAPTSSIFYKPLLIGRTRRSNGPEMVINAVPFGPADHENLGKFAGTIETAFLPRPQGSRTAIAVECARPEAGLPRAFESFRGAWKRTGKNLAAIGAPVGAPVRDVYYAGLWAAIRAGWREGYGAAAEIVVSAETLESAQEAIRNSPAFSAFSLDASSRFDADADLPSAAEKFDRSFAAEERAWIRDEFGRPFDLGGTIYDFAAEDIVRLAVRFGRGLKATEQLQETIRQSRSAVKTGKSFDLELVLDGPATTVTSPKELAFCLHWLKWRGHAAQLALPNLGKAGDLARNLPELAAIARHYQCTLSVRGREEYGPELLELIARSTLRRVNYKVSGALLEQPGYLDLVAEHLIG